MAVIDSVTPFARALYRKLGYAQQELEVLAVRGTFTFAADGQPLKLAAVQRPLRWSETFAGPADQPLRSVVAGDTDIVIGKPTTDIHASGSLHSPSGKPQARWLTALRIGPVKKLLRVCGPRSFQRTALGWRLSEAAPVASVALDYRRAFGGCWFAGAAPGNDSPAYVSHPSNPAGCGWLPNDADLKPLDKPAQQDIKTQIADLRELPAPQFEAPERPIEHPTDRHASEGFGPIARWWSPRRERQGTLDDAWRKYRYPEWPSDFDQHFHNSAHPDLMAPQWLAGDEPIALANGLREGTLNADGDRMWRSQLPGVAIYAHSEFESGRKEMTQFVLDTVGFDLDAGEITLTWHALYPPEDRLVSALIGGMPLDMWRRMLARQGSTR